LQGRLGQLLMTSVSDDRPLQNGHDSTPCSHSATHVAGLHSVTEYT